MFHPSLFSFLVSEFRRHLHEILHELINNNDGDNADSTYQTKMLQMIDDVISYKPPLPLQIDDSPRMAMSLHVIGNVDYKNDRQRHFNFNGGWDECAKEEEKMTETNDTLTSNQLYEIYGEEVFNRGCIDKNFRKNISPKLKFEVWNL